MLLSIIMLGTFTVPVHGNIFDYLPEKPCESMVVGVSSYSTSEGRYKHKWFFCIWYHNYHIDLDLWRSTFIFENVRQLTLITSDATKFASLLTSTSCLAIILENDDSEEVSFLIDFLDSLRVEEKHMFVKMNSVFDDDILSNMTINFDVIIFDTDRQSKGNIIFY